MPLLLQRRPARLDTAWSVPLSSPHTPQTYGKSAFPLCFNVAVQLGRPDPETSLTLHLQIISELSPVLVDVGTSFKDECPCNNQRISIEQSFLVLALSFETLFSRGSAESYRASGYSDKTQPSEGRLCRTRAASYRCNPKPVMSQRFHG